MTMRFVDRYRTDRGRLRFLQAVTLVLFLFLVLGLLWRQWLSYDLYKSLEEKQCLRRILYPATRGCIYDRNGLLLAGNRLHYRLAVRLEFLKKSFSDRVREFQREGPGMDRDTLEMEALWSVLSETMAPYVQYLGPRQWFVTPQKLMRHFRQEILMPITVVDDLTEKEYARLTEALPTNSPLEVWVENLRHYPNGSVACHTLGYVTSTPVTAPDELPGNHLKTFFTHRQAGRTGLEGYYDEWLSGLNGGEIWRVDPSGRRYRCIFSVPCCNGKDLHTTLDFHLQRVCEKSLGTQTGAVVVLDVKTGEVLALASTPGFDLKALSPRIPKNVFDDVTRAGGWLNRALQGLYPPGSAFKIVTLSAMLRHRIVDENSYVDCSGSFPIGNRVFHCHYRSGHGSLNLIEAIRVSCNPFLYKYALRCGPSPLCEEAKRFHFHEPTNIDLPFETRHMMVPSRDWKKRHLCEDWMPGDTANLSIGQGFLRVTPLQMACFAASFGRNETLTRPFLKIPEGPSPRVPQSQALDSTYYRELVRGMEASVESGSCRMTRLDGVRIAGKSSTSQVQVKGQSSFKHIAWFVGFAPVENPQIALSVMIEQTDLGEPFWGSKKAVPVARDIFSDVFSDGQK
ncbi:MAG: hypothetical protein LBR62_02675 [Puniceicoccales bacterium]|jgi:penicillin-binding protein 2|nr:hypothetical protein [Puniceicoccales bacterium]